MELHTAFKTTFKVESRVGGQRLFDFKSRLSKVVNNHNLKFNSAQAYYQSKRFQFCPKVSDRRNSL